MNEAYSNTFSDALAFTAHLHRTQFRKKTTIPYISHLMGVAAIVMESGGDEEQAIAGLLHDAVEDQGGPPTLELIRQRYGDEVARIVDACSDAAPIDGQTKAPWRQRKTEHLRKLRSADQRVLLVTVCDKIHNGEAIVNDLYTVGDSVWARFNAPREDVAWYYRSVLELAQARLDNTYACGRLERVVHAMTAT
jgi:(p)ppGpp synthase/HD superfamily hydrolase